MNCKEIHPLLTQYLLGDLKAEAADRVRVHVETCTTCQEELALLEPTLLLLSDALAEPATAQTRLESTRRKRVLRPVGRMRKTLHWVGTTHPKMSIAAGLVFVCGMLWTMLLPAMMSSRGKAQAHKLGNRGRQIHLGVFSKSIEAAALDLPEAWPQSGGRRRGKRRDAIEILVVEPEPMEELEDIEEIPADVSERIDGSVVTLDESLARSAGSVSPARKPSSRLVSSLREESVVASPVDVSVQPANFDSVAMVKSPVAMKGMYASRNPRGRAEALKRYGGGGALVELEGEEEDEVSVENINGSAAVGGGIAKGRIHYSDTDADDRSYGWVSTTESGAVSGFAGESTVPIMGDTPVVGRLFARTKTKVDGSYYRQDSVAAGNAIVVGVADRRGGGKLGAGSGPQVPGGSADKKKNLGIDLDYYRSDAAEPATPASSDESPARASQVRKVLKPNKSEKRLANQKRSGQASQREQLQAGEVQQDATYGLSHESKRIEGRTKKRATMSMPAASSLSVSADVNGDERQKALEKLEKIRIPELDFRQAKLADIADFFEQSSVAFGDDDESGSLSIAVTESPAPKPSSQPVVDGFADPFADNSGSVAGDESLVTFSARDITLKEALDITADVAGMKYNIGKDGQIVISPKNAAEGEIVTKMLDVPQVIMERFLQSGGEVGSRDGTVDVTDLFSEQGVDVPSRASVKYNKALGKLIAQNTPDNIKVLEHVVDALREAEAAKESRFKAFGVNLFVKVADQAFSTFAIDVDTAAYTLGRNYMQKGLLPPAESVRTEEYVNFFDYAYKAPTHATFKVYTEVAPSKFGRGQHLLKIGVKGRRLGREEQRQASLTFLIDTSGSMNQADRLGLVEKSLALLVNEMNPDDRVAIVQYDSHARVVLEHTPISNKAAILAAITRLQCGGSTNLEEGMHRAYALAAANFIPKGENRVLLLSDGVANLGSGAAEDILKKVEAFRRQGISCSVFGFGMGTYDDTMLETLANKGDGAYAFIDSIAEARRVFIDDLSATLNTIAADVKIQVEYSPEYVARYRQLGYENRQLKKQDFRNDAIDAGEVGSGQSVTALYELELAPPPTKPVLYGAQCLPLDDVIATVRVRYRRIDTGAVEEIEHRVRQRDVLPRFDAALPRFKLAAAVSEFSEILRGSPFAKGSSTEDVAAVLRPVALDLPLDKHVQELLRLVDRADSMSRGQ